LEASPGQEIGYHFKARGELERCDFAPVKFGMKGVVELELQKQRIQNREPAGTQKFVDFQAQWLFDHQLQNKPRIKITRGHDSLRRSLKI
jgi:hypothetical protein